MSSKAQRKANRSNSSQSTGPKTPQGKAASSANSTKHGLSSSGIAVLPTENQADLDALAAAITQEHRPVGDAETFLVTQMIASRWKLARIERLEAEAYDKIMESGFGPECPDRRVLNELTEPGNILDKLQRHSATAERSFYKALREFTQLRAKQQKSKEQNEANAAETWLQDLIAQTPDVHDPWISGSSTSPHPAAVNTEGKPAEVKVPLPPRPLST